MLLFLCGCVRSQQTFHSSFCITTEIGPKPSRSSISRKATKYRQAGADIKIAVGALANFWHSSIWIIFLCKACLLKWENLGRGATRFFKIGDYSLNTSWHESDSIIHNFISYRFHSICYLKEFISCWMIYEGKQDAKGKHTDQMHQKFSIWAFTMELFPSPCQLILIFLLTSKNTYSCLRFQFP